MKKKTYGAPRLVDWVANIKAGAATVRVHFTGGALTSYGVTPAEYTTDNAFIQKVIEQSKYFKEGRIVFLRETEIPDEARNQNPKPDKLAAKPKENPAPNPKPADEEPQTPAAPQGQSSDEVADAAEKADGGLTKVEASCLQDAQAYLQEKFNISSYKVRSYDAAQRAAAEHGVQFVGGKFTTPDNAEGDNTEEG